MQTLESYLNDGIHRDREDIAAVERVLHETGKTIAATFRPCTKDWPYEYRRGPQPKPGDFSQSTTAMMINGVDLLLGSSALGSKRSAYPFDLGADLGKRLQKQRKAAFEALVGHINDEPKNTRRKKPGIGTSSGTYGEDDPLTLSFLVEILSVANDSPSDLQDYAQRMAKELLGRDPAKNINDLFVFQDDQNSRPLSNAFVPLRVVRTCKRLSIADPEKGEVKYLRYFESTLHAQLSYSSIPDSRFDPAELIFCLEGMLSLSGHSIDMPLFERVVNVLEEAQRTSAHWRPTKPFLRSERGLALFPVSVEAANSLQRSCAEFDKDKSFQRYSERYIALFRRFWGWLVARRVKIDDNISGWHSDHIADPDSIQLWDSAQVVDFLLGYRRSLYNHIARTTLHLARFAVRPPKPAKYQWDEQTQISQKQAQNAVSEGTTNSTAPGGHAVAEPFTSSDKSHPDSMSETIVQNFEPVTSLGEYFETYKKVGRDFLEGWLKGAPERNFSMLLYGPPGTGKTTLAENLADALDFPMITITVSDFLAEGGSAIEARAKMIFEVLEAQTDCVILFDEIDELVLDRSSERHGRQDTVFKFMTPGMLTKINNLRRARRSIFIMATNYAYRIDPAIRRTGRIDENYLLLPPDKEAREKMIRKFLKKAAERRQAVAMGELHPDRVEGKNLSELASAAFFPGYSDIDVAISRALRGSNPKVADLTTEFKQWGRTTTLRFYKKALSEIGDDRDAVEREFLPLVYMAARENKQTAEKNTALYRESVDPLFQSPQTEHPFYVNAEYLQAKATEFVERQNRSDIGS